MNYKGDIEFECYKCGETKNVGFTFKSRFCTSCGKVYTDNWIENILGNLINIRHIIFTIPEELRDFLRKIAAKYVGRYVGLPVIAESRILDYDGVNVTYKYKRHEE